MNSKTIPKSLNEPHVDAYPTPPFEHQKQPFPGLASKMNPLPDHGELTYKGSERLKGRKALITGGDSGIGRAVAIAFAREGAQVAINYLPDEEPDAKQVVDLLWAEGLKVVAIPGDIRDEKFCQQLVKEAEEKLGGLDLLVNNAGRQQFCDSIKDLTTEAFDATYKTNVYAMFWITKAALEFIPRGGSIINTTSVQAFSPSDNLLDYSSTKASIMAFTKGLAKQLAGDGIRVNGVAPGPYWTPLQISGGQPQEKIESFGEQAPLKRPGQPAEIAPLYVTLASSESSYSSGQIWCSDGGTGTV
ncbi:SDR family oxidoreductase [Rahnella victoriana]|uniref:SDR family oxidoreductase n=1 Tax=Rahnella victoriana TaxID=1510570 RepID=A0ABS0DUM4_9GAMM|nr:SDR family oxidoreductase [Rahnella victoriana]VTQ52643.1 short-chain dehydrogenase/reductase sdr [Campylobacter jejuni]MBF7957574.1 SDR family oxidoreductase [Rahnella victoriana]PBI78029.1 NAD(P)-dependent oxidoreductase [Rahnella victoriana]TBX36126.1 SDR family oxidoreductase [Rahnella victoriana]UHM93335.1 SDR family oxidoreductase [Rahnella victoriana]